MNRNLPFALSAIGLISLAVYQPALAQQAEPSLTIEISSGEPGPATPPDGVFTFQDAPVAIFDSFGNAVLDANGNPLFVRFPEGGNSDRRIAFFSQANGGIFGTGINSIGPSAAEAEAAARLEIQTIVNLGFTFLGLGAAPAPDPLQVPGTPGVAGSALPTVEFNNLDSAVVLNSFADPSAVLAQQLNVVAGQTVENAAGATLAASSNTLSADATVINQLASQSIATGEDSLAVAVLDTTIDNTTSTALIDTAVVGVRIDNEGALTGATSVTVNANSAVATARANDSTSALVATGANSGVAGNDAASPDNDSAYPAPGPLVIEGDLIATGVQQLDQLSNVRAEVDNVAVGLTEADVTAPASVIITGGVAVSDNRLAAVADGNRLALQLNDALSGGDVDSTVYGLQTVSDTSITANAGANDGNRVGAVVDLIENTAVTVSSNQVQAAATGTRATATVAAAPDQSDDSLLVDVEQFVRAQAEDTSITASATNNQIGRISRRGEGVTTTVSGNTLTAVGIGNDQATTAALGQGSIEGDTEIEGDQVLLLDGANLSITGEVLGGVVGTQLTGRDLDPVTTISGNTVIGQAIGNNASQATGAFAGTLDDDLDLDLEQTAIGSAAETLLVQGRVEDLLLGAAADQLRAPQLTISDNAVASLSTVNSSSQTVGAISGSSTDDGERDIDSDQQTDSVAVGAEVTDLLIGATADLIRESNDSSTATISVSGNSVNAQAELNRATQTLVGVSGLLGGEIEPEIDQDANADAGGLSSVDAALVSAGLGVFDNAGEINVEDGSFNLGVSNNTLSAQANANVSQVAVGALAITLDDDGEIAANIDQAATDTAVTASAIDLGLGLTEGETVLGTDTNDVGINATGNTLQTLARQNSATVVQGVISGDLATNDVDTIIAQEVNNGSTTASNSGVFVGVTPAAGFDDLALGSATESTVVTVTGNTLRADAASSIATITGSGVSGLLGNGDVSLEITQDNAGNAVTATTSLVVLGAGLQNNQPVGAGEGGITTTVADNSVVTVASGNNASTSVGGFSGVAEDGSNIELLTQQTLNGQITASAGLIDAGITDADLGTGDGAATLTVSSNTVLTAANGNDSRTDFGDVAASITSEQRHRATQTVNADASLSADAGNLRIGAVGIGSLGTTSPVAVTVDANQVRTSVVANSSTSGGALSGTLAGDDPSFSFTDTQTLNGSDVGSSATSGSDLAPIVIGAQAEELGANGSVSVANNGVTSAVAGNRVLNNLDSAAFASVSGSGGLAFSATQTLNGNPAATADLLSAVENTSVGVLGGDTALPAVSVAGNRLVADTVGNQASRVLNNLSGNFNADTIAVSLNDVQTVDTATLVASVSDSFIGGSFTSDVLVPTAVTVNGNQVVAQAIANSSNQLVSLNGASVQGGQLTSLNAAQNLINSNVTATISNVNVGLVNAGVNPGAASFTGAAVTAGNSLTATAIGNQASLVRNGR